MVQDLKPHRFTVAEYHRMARAGILGEDDRLELIEGEIVDMTPIGPQHAACVDGLTAQFTQLFRDVAQVRVQNPIRLDDYTEPQPDLTLLQPRPDRYASRHPTAEDVLLVVEVALSSVEPDRRVKVPLYARCGILEVWCFDLEAGTITAYQEPGPQGYRTVRVFRRGERIAPVSFPDRELAVSDLLG